MSEQVTDDRTGSGSEGQPAPAGPIRVSWAPVPRVNLLPVEIIDGRRFRRTQVILGAVVLGSVLIACGGTFWAQRGIDDAKGELVIAQSRTSVLTAEQARYAAVPRVIAALDQATNARELAMNTDVLWYRYLNYMDSGRPAGVALSGFTLTMNAVDNTAVAGAAAAVGVNPLTPAGVGTVLANGTALQYRDVASWLEALNKIPGFAASSLTSAAKTPGGSNQVTFGTGAVITSAAESGRYTKKAG